MKRSIFPLLGVAVSAALFQSLALAQNEEAMTKEVAASPFAPKPCDSYSNYKNDKGETVYPLWGSLKPLDFG